MVAMNSIRRRGFTIVELLVTVSIAAILLAVAVPSFQTMIVESRLTTQVNDMVGALNIARSEAIKRNASVSLCRASSATAAACAGAAGAWQHWIIRSAAGSVVRRGVVDTFGGKIAVASTLASDEVVFSSDGLARTGNALVANHQISVCATNLSSNNFRQLTLGSASRISVTKNSGTCS